MKAILSCTFDDLYLFNLPFAVHSWHKLGVECVVFSPLPVTDQPSVSDTTNVVRKYLPDTTITRGIFCSKDKAATYAQCSRLYAAALPSLKSSEVLITSDADMCVFSKEYWNQFDHQGWINVIGNDLVPEGQVPMCYISMPAVGWHTVMDIRAKTLQECLDDLLGNIEAENFRGNYWGKDQETAFQHLYPSHAAIIRPHPRAYPGTQFATRRADRDGWPEQIPLDIIDAHLPRPGYLQENFEKIYQLFQTMYQNDDHSWMYRYCVEYQQAMEA